jgi:hypothetical protein
MVQNLEAILAVFKKFKKFNSAERMARKSIDQPVASGLSG